MADNAEFYAKYAAHKAHVAAVPGALEAVRAKLTDYNGQPLTNAEAPIAGLRCGDLRTLLAEVERLHAQVRQQRADAIEAQREFSREAREIAAQARFDERESRNDYGTY